MASSVSRCNSSIDPGAWRRLMSLIDRCTTMQRLKQIHALLITHGLSSNTFAISKLLAFSALSASGDLSYASLLFRNFPSPNSFFYNTLIRASSRSSHPQLALRYFNLMLHDKTAVPDQHTFPFVFIACAAGCWVDEGQKLHALVLKNGFGSSDGYVQTSLLRFYCDCNDLQGAHKVFDESSQRDVFKWNVLMNGYVKGGFPSKGLDLFKDMLESDIEPDEFCVTTAINACAKLGTMWQGKWVHEYVKRRGDIVLDDVVGTALVDMYAKCGSIDMAMEVFEGIPDRNVHCWAALISGLAFNGYAKKAISCLDRMQVVDGLTPDGVALLGALVACTHGGHIEEGMFLFEHMEAKYGIAPKHEHYSCVVDMLCKAGQLSQALAIIKRMPMKPLASVWGALLSGCRIHKNIELAELAVKELELLRDGRVEDGKYVELSNIYLALKKVEDASKIRRMIAGGGMKKTPGWSAIEVDGKVHEFVSGDASHPHLAQIHTMLEFISFHLFRDPIKTLAIEERYIHGMNIAEHNNLLLLAPKLAE